MLGHQLGDLLRLMEVLACPLPVNEGAGAWPPAPPLATLSPMEVPGAASSPLSSPGAMQLQQPDPQSRSPGGRPRSVIAECIYQFRSRPPMPREERTRVRSQDPGSIHEDDFWWHGRSPRDRDEAGGAAWGHDDGDDDDDPHRHRHHHHDQGPSDAVSKPVFDPRTPSPAGSADDDDDDDDDDDEEEGEGHDDDDRGQAMMTMPPGSLELVGLEGAASLGPSTGGSASDKGAERDASDLGSHDMEGKGWDEGSDPVDRRTIGELDIDESLDLDVQAGLLLQVRRMRGGHFIPAAEELMPGLLLRCAAVQARPRRLLR
jgi:hypothetical protein